MSNLFSKVKAKTKNFFSSSKDLLNNATQVTQISEKPLPPLPGSIPNLVKLTQTQIDVYNDAKLAMTMIERFIVQLKTEMDERSKKFGKRFIRLFPNTKSDKIDELDKLKKNIQQTIDGGAERLDLKQSDWHLLVSTAMNNKKIKRTFILEPRALKVLQNILDGHPNRGIFDPVGKDIKDTTEWQRPNFTKRWW